MAKKTSKYANALAAVKISSTSKGQDRAASARGGTKPAAMNKAKKIAGSAAKPKSRGERIAEGAAKAAKRVVRPAFYNAPGRMSVAEKEAMRKSEAIVATRIAGERGRSATRARTEKVKERAQTIKQARKTARRVVTGR